MCLHPPYTHPTNKRSKRARLGVHRPYSQPLRETPNGCDKNGAACCPLCTASGVTSVGRRLPDGKVPFTRAVGGLCVLPGRQVRDRYGLSAPPLSLAKRCSAPSPCPQSGRAAGCARRALLESTATISPRVRRAWPDSTASGPPVAPCVRDASSDNTSRNPVGGVGHEVLALRNYESRKVALCRSGVTECLARLFCCRRQDLHRLFGHCLLQRARVLRRRLLPDDRLWRPEGVRRVPRGQAHVRRAGQQQARLHGVRAGVVQAGRPGNG